MMGWILRLFSLLLALSANHFPPSLARQDSPIGSTCPFPLPKSIHPCSCRIDKALQVDIICKELYYGGMDAQLIRKLTDAFGTKNKIRLFEIELSSDWSINFSADTTGKFRLSKLHISEIKTLYGDFYPGAFHETLEEIAVTHRSYSLRTNKTQVRINSGVFAHLPNLKIVSLPKTVLSIAPGAFFNLPSLTEIDFSGDYEMRGLLRKIEEATFMDLPNLQKLDLSYNKDLCHLGNMFTTVKNPDLFVNLDETNVNVLLEEVFKPFVETVTKNNGKGKINMRGVPLQCGCDAKWLKDVNVAKIFHEATCQDGTPLQQVDWTVHEMWCPPSSTPGYEPVYGEMYPLMLASEDRGSVGKSREEQNTRFHENYTISALNGPVQISFEYLKGGTNRWNSRGHVTLTDGDGTVLLDHATTQDVVPVLTSNSNIIHVEFVSPSRESGRGRTFNPDSFKLNWQGKGGYVTQDRNIFCECCK